MALQRCTPADAEALTAFADAVLRDDYFFRRGHWADLLARPERYQVYAVVANRSQKSGVRRQNCKRCSSSDSCLLTPDSCLLTPDSSLLTPDSCLLGIAVMYCHSRLHNLFLDPAVRRQGIGGWLLEQLQPAEIRAKIDMKAGDPRPFYAKYGYLPVKTSVVRGPLSVATDNGRTADRVRAYRNRKGVKLLRRRESVIRGQESPRNSANSAVP